jgi:hypothetical protein
MNCWWCTLSWNGQTDKFFIYGNKYQTPANDEIRQHFFTVYVEKATMGCICSTKTKFVCLCVCVCVCVCV